MRYNIQGGIQYGGRLCPPYKINGGDFVHLCKFWQGGLCPGGILSYTHSRYGTVMDSLTSSRDVDSSTCCQYKSCHLRTINDAALTFLCSFNKIILNFICFYLKLVIWWKISLKFIKMLRS